ncbi:hypothetical protein MPDQ_003329 [Monascus purpureus]|uniref:Uncharacterized protein n=1 Tax=Monascus purpureus TaxID=5098 RepID=A0A507QZ97_MONPU|nr:hypothetical protein MPDQ_003329 [Monascus purpureus]
MGWFDSFSFLQSLYGGQRSRSHIPRPQSDDAVPLRRDSTTEANRGISSTSPSHSNVDTTSYIANGDDESTTLEHWIVPPEHIEQSQADVEVSNNPRAVNSACPDPHVPSSELRQSKRLSRGLAGFMTFFRRNKARHDLSISIPAHKSRRPAISSILFKDDGVNGTTGDTCDAEDTRLHTQHSQRVGHHGVECLADDASRKVSDQTILSEESARTSATVSHHPLKRTPHPVTTGYPNYVYEKPFDGIQGISSSVIEPTPSGPSKCTVGSMKLSSSECSDDESQIIYRAATIPEELRHHTPRNHPFIPTSTPRETSRREVSEGSTVSSLFDQREAAVAFNRVAERLGLQPLKLDGDDVRTVFSKLLPDYLIFSS